MTWNTTVLGVLPPQSILVLCHDVLIAAHVIPLDPHAPMLNISVHVHFYSAQPLSKF